MLMMKKKRLEGMNRRRGCPNNGGCSVRGGLGSGRRTFLELLGGGLSSHGVDCKRGGAS